MHHYGLDRRIESLKRLLKDPEENVRLRAIDSLSRIEAIADLDTYAHKLDSSDRATKIQVIHLLGELAAEAALELLRLQIGAEDDDVRSAVIQSLRDNSDGYERPEVREKAVDIALTGLADENLSVKTVATEALARFGDPRAAKPLSMVIDSIAGDEGDEVQLMANALLALGEVGNREIVPKIIEKAETGKVEVREAALKALGKIGDPRAEDCLIQALSDDDPRIRMQAAESLGRI